MLRIKRHLTQYDLAGKAGLQRTHISKVEDGRVTSVRLVTLERYAQGLGTRGSSLMALLENPAARPAKPLRHVDETMVQYIGPTLRRLRNEAGKNRMDVQRAIGFSANQLCHLEKGRTTPTLAVLQRLAPAIGKPVSVVIAEIENAAYPDG